MKKREDRADPESSRPARPADDETIAVCMGEFGIGQARRLRALWESVWPQDRRAGGGKAPRGRPRASTKG